MPIHNITLQNTKIKLKFHKKKLASNNNDDDKKLGEEGGPKNNDKIISNIPIPKRLKLKNNEGKIYLQQFNNKLRGKRRKKWMEN